MIDSNETEDSSGPPPKDDNDLWINRIDRRERYLKEKASVRHWDRYEREYQGDFSELLSGTNRVIPLNLIYAYVRTEIPSLYIQDPYFEFTPKQRTTIGSAKLKEIAVNDLWHRKKFKREVKKGIQDGKIIGHAWYKVGYNANLGNIEQYQDSTENPNNEDYFFYRLNWRHVLFNDESVDPPYDSTWIAHKFYVPLEIAKSNKEWKNTDNLVGVKLSGNETKENLKSVNSNATQGDIEYAELYEVWDKVNKKVLIVSKLRHVGVLHSRDWPYELMQGFPFLFLSLSFVNDDPYGISDVGMGEMHVLEKTKLRTAYLEHIKRGNRQLLTKDGNFSQEAKDMYRKGDDSALIECENPDAVRAMPYAAFQTDAFSLESRLDDDLAQIWGQKPTDRSGQARTQTRTKYELQSQNTGTTNRLAEEQNIVQDIVEEAAEKLSCLLEQYATTPYYVKITGYKPQEIAQMLISRPSATKPDSITTPHGYTMTSDDIKGPVDVRIREGSAIPLDKQSKLALLKDLAQTYLELNQRPAGPFMGALAKMIVEEAGLHELAIALEQEGQFQAKQAQAAQAQQEQQRQTMIGQKSAEMQMQAEEINNKKQHNDATNQIKLLNMMKEIQLTLAQMQQDRVTENNNQDNSGD
jgi:hypothetical protein